jgi:hypothetical protein
MNREPKMPWFREYSCKSRDRATTEFAAGLRRIDARFAVKKIKQPGC